MDFNYNGSLLAIAPNDKYIDIAHTDTGEQIHKISLNHRSLSVAWHPSKNYLAYSDENINGSFNILGYTS